MTRKVKVIRDSEKAFGVLYSGADIAVLTHLGISDNEETLDLWSSKLFAVSPEVVRLLSRVKCVKKAEPLHGSSNVILLSTEVIGTNNLLKSLKEVFEDLEISVLE